MGAYRLSTPLLDRIFRRGTVSGLSEWELLNRYLEERDELAFEALVARHGPMVMGVCRRLLADQSEVEDAFQATFLVLVRRARQLGPGDCLGAWLYGVAVKVALRARSAAARRRRLESVALPRAAARSQDTAGECDLSEVLDFELGKLPSKYRSPVVLCFLEGQTHEEAARQLQWPVGTVKGRLARAKDLLRLRLARRGLAPSVGALTLALSRDSSAAIHRQLINRTVTASLQLALGGATAQVVSTSVATLVEGVVTSMLLNTLKSASLAVVVCGFFLFSAGVMARQASAPNLDRQPPVAAKVVADTPPAAAPTTTSAADATEAPAPADPADAGLKVPDLERELARAALNEWEDAYKSYSESNAGAGLDRAYQASKRLLDAESSLATTPAESLAARQGHFGRIRDLARAQSTNAAATTDGHRAQINAYAAEANLWLAQAGAQTTKAPAHTTRGPVEDTVDQNPKTRIVLGKLEEPIAMAFVDETALEDVLKYIQQSTVSPDLPQGIPIYVDPVGMQEAEKSMTSTIRNINLEGIPLRRTLQLVMKQLDLCYTVVDGMLYITSLESADQPLGAPMHTPSPLMLRVAKAERGELTLEEMKEFAEFLKTRHQVLQLSEGSSTESAGAERVPAPAPAPAAEPKRDQQQVDALLKELRELIAAAKAERERPAGNAPAAKPRTGGGLQ